MSLQKFFECAHPLVDGLNFKLSCIALTYIDDIEGDNFTHLDPQEVISKQAIWSYFEKEIREQVA